MLGSDVSRFDSFLEGTKSFLLAERETESLAMERQWLELEALAILFPYPKTVIPKSLNSISSHVQTVFYMYILVPKIFNLLNPKTVPHSTEALHLRDTAENHIRTSRQLMDTLKS